MTDDLTPDQIEEMRFRNELERSHKASLAVAGFLQRRGWQVEVPETVIRPRFEDRHKYGDKGDVFMWKDDVPRRKVEVKWRTFDFTCGDSFPYPTIIVDRATKSGVLSDLYFNVCRALTHSAIVVTALSKQFWKTVTLFDRKKGHEVVVFQCSKEHADFVDLQPPKPKDLPNPFFGRCQCGDPGMFFAHGKWFCNEHRVA